MSSEIRSFDLGDILSVTTGYLVSKRHIGGVYDILNHMTGDNLFTHQLPRAADMCKPAILDQHPQLALVASPETFDGKAHVESWLVEQEDAYGLTLPILPLASWRQRDPIEELAGMVGPDKPIIVAVTA
jgi:hypothetical protein